MFLINFNRFRIQLTYARLTFLRVDKTFGQLLLCGFITQI